MSEEEQRIAIAEACGWTHVTLFPTYGHVCGWPPGRIYEGTTEPDAFSEITPDYLNDLNAIHEAEKTLDLPQFSSKCSSNPHDHAPMRYLAELGKVCGLKTREELVLSCEDKDKGKLNFRPGPYPMPIELPPSAIILGHFIPAYGYETCLIRATAAQRAEAFLKAIGKWKD